MRNVKKLISQKGNWIFCITQGSIEQPELFVKNITFDELWILQNDLDIQKVKTMMIVFVNIHGGTMTDSMSEIKTVIKKYYIEALIKLKKKIRA